MQKYFHHDFTNSPAAPTHGQVLKSIGDACPTHQNCCNIIYNCSNLYTCHPIAYSTRCLGQENPCEGISLGSCLVEEESILNTYSARPDKCSKLCDMNNNCEFWKARWDGTLCHLLISDYRHVSNFCILSWMSMYSYWPTRTVVRLPDRSTGSTARRVNTPATPMWETTVSTRERG